MEAIMGEQEYPRQHHITLMSALNDAVIMFRAEAVEWRNQSGRRGAHGSKNFRRAVAAEYDERVRLLEAEIASRLSPTGDV
jgi:hypothetical protein